MKNTGKMILKSLAVLLTMILLVTTVQAGWAFALPSVSAEGLAAADSAAPR
ncbi:MAG: hypothetical protein LBJ11_03425 [Oscillospiraceae bacterium]|nr:hypothetical protein [Oscillospiraceae bacterium]